MANNVGIIRTPSSNWNSVKRAMDYLKISNVLISQKKDFTDIAHIIIPGTGTYGDVIKDLENQRIIDSIFALKGEGRFVLGICLGMQIMGEQSTESSNVSGLGWFTYSCLNFENIRNRNKELKTPHTGWNFVNSIKAPASSIVNDGDYYFSHSFYVPIDATEHIAIGVTENGLCFTSAFKEDNIIGLQFHPEKSQAKGLEVLKKFSEQK